MKILYKKLSILFVMAFVIMAGCFNSSVFAADGVIGTENLNNTTENSAKIGDILTKPEKGWIRYNDSDVRIIRNTSENISSKAYNGDYMLTKSISFKFYGTKLRLISAFASNYRCKNLAISIDGNIERFDQCLDINGNEILCYKNEKLSQGIHFVNLYTDSQTIAASVNNNMAVELDAIDIDSAGELLAYGNTTLSASGINNAITLNWNAIDGVTKYNVKRSTTQGSEYITIASDFIGTTYNDTSVQVGTSYYYIVIPVINGIEGTTSNEVSAKLDKTVIQPSDNTGNAIFTITMTNGNVKSYTVPMSKVNDFISWYDNRVSGSTGKAYYVFDKTDNLQPFSKKTEYIVFDKISSYEVDEYTK